MNENFQTKQINAHSNVTTGIQLKVVLSKAEPVNYEHERDDGLSPLGTISLKQNRGHTEENLLQSMHLIQK